MPSRRYWHALSTRYRTDGVGNSAHSTSLYHPRQCSWYSNLA